MMRKDLVVLPLVLPCLGFRQAVRHPVLDLAAPGALALHSHSRLSQLLATLETALLVLGRDRIVAAACCAPAQHSHSIAVFPIGTSCCHACAGWAPQRCPA
jgi:hypothetical protein